MGLKRTALPAYALAMMLAASTAMPVVAETRGAAASIINPATIRIDNFGQVNTHYYRGAQPQGRDYADLAALGITTVIDLQRDGDQGEKSLVEQAGMKFVRIPMTTHVAPTSEQIAHFMQLVSDSGSQRVYVHCAGGRHRTGVMTAIYRIEQDGWTADQAFAEMKRYKFGLDFLHPEFKAFVYGYRSNNMLARSDFGATAAH
jgi:protein tyrosine/serine phosphatase